MHHLSRPRRPAGLPILSALVATALATGPLPAIITVSPASVTVTAGQTTAAITLGITTPPVGPPPGATTLILGGLPAGVTTVPAPVSFGALGTFQAVQFQLSTSAGTPGGSYPVSISCSPDIGAGTGTVTLIVQSPGSFTAQATPNPLALPWGGAASVQVTTTPLGGFSTPITYWFTGLPAGISWGAPQTVPLPYPPVAFPFAVAAGTPPGTYTGSLVASWTTIGTQTQTFPMTVIVQPPGLAAAFSPPSLALCDGGPAVPAALLLTPSGGYAGTPTLAWSGIPPGIEASPPSPVTAPLPPASTVPVSLRAIGAAAGSYPVRMRVTDPSAGIDLTATLTVSVGVGSFTPNLSPASLTLRAGGAAGAVQASLAADSCFSASPVSVTATGLPPGVALSPPSALLAGPGWTPVSFSLQASAATPPGSYNATFRFDPPSGTSRTATLALTIGAAPDFSLEVSPPSLRVVAGSAGTMLVGVAGRNEFGETVAVTAPSLPGITFTPASFPLPAGGSRTVEVRAAREAPAGTLAGAFQATAPGIAGVRTAPITLTVAPRPPVITSLTPPALTAGTANAVVRITGLDFQTGATVSISPAGPVVTQTRVLSPTLAEIVVTTPAGTAPGPHRVELRNPDGGASEEPATVLVCPPSTLAAPLGVTTAAIVFPRPFTAVAPNTPVFPRAVLGTTGLGTIVGTWRLDGVPFDPFVVTASGGLPVEVRSHLPLPSSFAGEHRLELVVEQPQRLATEPVPVIYALASASGLRVLAPEDETVLDDPEPLFRWSLVPGASGYEVEVETEGRPWPLRVRLSESEWRPDAEALERLGPGSHRFRVFAVFPGEVRGEPTPWRSFVLPGETDVEEPPEPQAGPAAMTTATPVAPRLALFVPGPARFWGLASTGEGPGAGSPPASAAEGHRDWQFVLLGTASETDEEQEATVDAGRVQLTAQADLLGRALQLKATGDTSYRKDLDPRYGTAPESRSWQLELAALQPGFREEVRAGYSPPEFLDQSEFLAAGLARGGALGKVATPAGAFSYYGTFFDDALGAAGGFGLTQTLEGAGWQAPIDPNRGLVRVFGLRAAGDSSFGLPATEAEGIGLLARWALGPSLTLSFEGARGTLAGGAAGSGNETEGFGFRLGASGTAGAYQYALNLRKVDAELVNPANLGLTAGAVPDRLGGDLMVGRAIGRATVSLQLRSLESGSLPGGGGTEVAERAGNLSLFAPLGSKANVNLNAGLTTTKCDGDPGHGLPGSDRSMLTLGATFTETLGGFSLSQALNWMDLGDDLSPAFDQEVTSGTLSAGGSLAPWLALTAMVSGTRTEAAFPVGTSDLWVASLQPTLTWAKAALTLTPRASFSRFESALAGRNDSEQYQLLLQWSPAWMRSLAAFQVAADWTRNVTAGLPAPSFERRVVGNLTLRWGLSQADFAAPPPPPLPAPTPPGVAQALAIRLGRRA
ncbi:MAG: hypothetical protein M5U13_07530 [Thermoanaerobaculia bacterium]|nr:hypothetical protein [Thermoanaerobaculia bacterium]